MRWTSFILIINSFLILIKLRVFYRLSLKYLHYFPAFEFHQHSSHNFQFRHLPHIALHKLDIKTIQAKKKVFSILTFFSFKTWHLSSSLNISLDSLLTFNSGRERSFLYFDALFFQNLTFLFLFKYIFGFFVNFLNNYNIYL